MGMSKLLVIDDCTTNHFIIDKLLDKCGLFPDKVVCLDAEEAINQIEENFNDESKLPDVIFLDLMMPNFNGFNFLERFENVYPAIAKSVQIFILTCSLNPTDRIESEKIFICKRFFC